MFSPLRRRVRQVRQIGPLAAIRIAYLRAWTAANGVKQGIMGHVVASGLASWSREDLPLRIIQASSPDGDRMPMGCLQDEFDLLQSGRRKLRAFVPATAFPGPWRRTAQRIEAECLQDRSGIDWHVDPTSEFRWNPCARTAAIAIGSHPGVEVKWPWEVGRLQHLPAIAIAAAGPDLVAAAAKVIQRHTADFIRCNPPGFGVQWLCPMDVGIRIANVLTAVDLARASGADFSPTFLHLVSASARDHARYIVRHLEWGESLCSNHYLANIAGLLYVGAYLPDDPESSEWLAFAGREMAQQIRAQFHPEGSNFEASTCYHRLSSEMAIHSAALMLWIARNQPERAARWWSGRVRCFHPSPAAPPTARVAWHSGLSHPFDDELRSRLWGMGRFTETLCRSDGTIPQIGDNDSGRFMRLEMSNQPYADIDDHRHLIRASRALFGRVTDEHGQESEWLARWLGDAVLPVPKDLESTHWPEFGLYVWRRAGFVLTLRCGHIGQRGNGGHAHCDQLSITLSTDDGPIIDDPGTGVYTPRPAVRNELRSSACHSTVLVPGREQGDWLPGRWGLFAMRDVAKARMVRMDDDGAAAEMFEGPSTVRRRIELRDRAVQITDEAPSGAVANFVIAPGVEVKLEGVDRALLRRGSTVVRLSGVRIRITECPWSSRYGHVSLTNRIQCDAGRCALEVL